MMTPKEKAEELAHKFRLLEIRTSENSHMMISMSDAKECALIAVNEMIKIRNEIINTLKLGALNIEVIAFLEEVKQEIENL